MSKKKGKAAPKRASSKAPARRAPARMAAARPAAPRQVEGGGRTVYATIYIYRTGQGNKIRTAPQRLFANPGDRISWTVVNLIDGSDVPVRLTWPEPGPWGKESIEFRSTDRRSLDVRTKGKFKYVVSALDTQEDPEIVIPDI
jgi:hypothetical protein